MGFHSDELFKIGSEFLIKDWVFLRDESFATKAYQRSKTLTRGVANKTTTIDLEHAPEK